MTVIRSKVRWNRITTPMMAVISNRRLVIILIGFKRSFSMVVNASLMKCVCVYVFSGHSGFSR